MEEGGLLAGGGSQVPTEPQPTPSGSWGRARSRGCPHQRRGGMLQLKTRWMVPESSGKSASPPSPTAPPGALRVRVLKEQLYAGGDRHRRGGGGIFPAAQSCRFVLAQGLESSGRRKIGCFLTTGLPVCNGCRKSQKTAEENSSSSNKFRLAN